jgi:hypothetical protein
MPTNPFYPPILTLAPGRAGRRLALVHRGLVELNDFTTRGLGPQYAQLERWGLIVSMPEKHMLDAYRGYRPTPKGQAFMMYDESFHLIMVRKNKVKELEARVQDESKVRHEAIWASFGVEVASAVARGFSITPPDPTFLAAKDRALIQYVRRGYRPLDEFRTLYDLSSDELIVAGVLRHLEHRDPTKQAVLVVGAKAKDCLFLSSRWQFILVKPGMEHTFLERCAIIERIP